jgi:hypothetical protein
MTIKLILQQGLEAEEMPATEPASPAYTFARTAVDLVGHLLGSASWK